MGGVVVAVFQSKIVQTAIIAAVTKNLSEKTNTDISIKRVRIRPFKNVVLDEIYMSDQKKDTLLYIEQLVANIDLLSFKSKQINLASVELIKPEVSIEKYNLGEFNFNFLLDLYASDNAIVINDWLINGDVITLSNGFFTFKNPTHTPQFAEFVVFDNLNVELSDIKILPERNYSFKLSDLSMHSLSGFEMKKLSANFQYRDSTLIIDEFIASSKYSEVIIDTIHADLNAYLKSGMYEDVFYEVDITSIDFGFRDIAYWYSDFGKVEFSANLSGKLRGTLDDLRGRDFVINVGDFTRLNGDFYINGLPDYRSSYIFFDLNESFADLNEIRNLDLPPRIKTSIDNLPSFFDNLGAFSYRGNFTGFLDDFVAYGTAYSNLGTLRTDVSIRPHKEESLFLSGQAAVIDLNIGEIFGNDDLDKITFNGDLFGTIDYDANFDFVLDGRIDSLDYRDYRFRMIDIDGEMINDRFAGALNITDPNIEMNFHGKLDLSSELPEFNFNASVGYINLGNLNLIENNYSVASFDVDANFSGNSVNNIKGNVLFDRLYFENENDSVTISQIEMINTVGHVQNIFTVRSDIVDGEIIGNYNFQEMGQSLISFYQHYLPSSYYTSEPQLNSSDDFSFSFRVKDIDPLARLFRPGLELAPDILIEGNYNAALQRAALETAIPFLSFDNKEFENITMRLDAHEDQFFCRTNSGKINIGRRSSLYNFTVNVSGANDQLDIDLFWNNYQNQTYSGTIKTSTSFEKTNTSYPHVVIDIEPANLYFADSLWHLAKTQILVDSSSIQFDNFSFYSHNHKQYLNIDGLIAENPDAVLNIGANNIDLLLLEPLMATSDFTGYINGQASLQDAYSHFMLEMEMEISNLSFNRNRMGDLILESYWDTEEDNLVSNLEIVNNNDLLLSATGTIDPIYGELDLQLDFIETPIAILEVFIPSTFNAYEGLVSGSVHLNGDVKHLKHDGMLTPVGKCKMGISYLNTIYSFDDPVHFKGDSIVFQNINIFDVYGNRGVLRGQISHKSFKNMEYDLSIEASRIHALNTTIHDNPYFYGAAFLSGDVEITGADLDILISGNVRSERGTVVNIPFETASSAQRYDFVEFVGTRQLEQTLTEYNVSTSGLNINFDLEVTPEARLQIIFNNQMGDIIRGTGNGNLQVRVDRNYNIDLYGDYIIEEGDYLFTLQNVVNKRFSIERGSTMEWIGDPYDALIDITAVYKVKPSLHDLFVGAYDNVDLSRRIPVDCIIYLKETLNQPDISFAVELPTAEERIKDEVSQLIATPEDVNKQIISLLMLGRFYTPEFFAGRAAGETGAELVGTTASELISNQLSNWLSKMSNVFDLGVNYRPGNEITNDQLEFAISTQILNDRITINGNFANNANPTSNNNSEIIGDFDFNIKLTENGKFQFKAYNRSNDNLIYDTAPYTQGIGFSYREDFNRFADLVKRYKALINRRNRKISEEPDDELSEML